MSDERPANATGAIWLLVNPRAGGGRGAQRVRAAHEALAAIAPVEIHETRAAGDETRIATEAASANPRALVVLGGDGTVSHTARALITARSDVPLAMLAAGTGNDFAKSLALPVHDFERMAALVQRGTTRRVDAGEADGIPFVNAAGFGFDVEVLERLRDSARADTHSNSNARGTSRLVYARAALGALLGYRGFTTDDGVRQLLLVFANGAHFGGAFRIAPTADLEDGALLRVAIHDVPPLARIPLFARATRGAHVRSPHVEVSRGTEWRLRFPAPPAFEVDGELQQAKAAEITVRALAGAIRVIC